jgi:ankyrin repeat protein
MRRRKARPSHRASWALAGAAAALVLCGPQAVRVRAAETPLIQAVKAGDARAVKAVLRPSTVNVPETDGTTALHWAVQADDLATVELLLRGGADPRARNRYGVTPLSVAALNANATLVERLVDAGADPNTTRAEGETVLMTAARAGSASGVRILLARGADVDARERWLGQTALMMAAAENHADVIGVLVDAGADVNARSKATDLPNLNWGVAGMSTTVFPRGHWTPLMFAAQQGSLDAVRALADRRANLDMVDPDGTTALILAIINAHYDVAATLLERGADPNLGDSTGMAGLYAAVDMNTLPWMHNRPPSPPSGRLDAVDLIKLLLVHGADPNARLQGPTLQKHHDAGDRNLGEGSTALMRAAKAADSAAMRLLLAAGADPTLVQRNGTNALMIAGGIGRGNAGSYGRVSGSAQEAIDAVAMLIDAGLNVRSANADGQTALHGAAGRSDDVPALIQFLVDRGADPTAKNKRGQTPLDIARGGAQVGTLRVQNQANIAILSQLTTAASHNAAQ